MNQQYSEGFEPNILEEKTNLNVSSPWGQLMIIWSAKRGGKKSEEDESGWNQN